MEDDISHMHLIRLYENESLCEIDSDQGGGGGGLKKFPNKNQRKLIFLIE